MRGNESDVPRDHRYGQLPIKEAVEATLVRNLQVKANAYTYASEVAISEMNALETIEPLASSKVTNSNFVPIRVVSAADDGAVTGVARIDPETHLWVKTKPTKEICKSDIVPASTIRNLATTVQPSPSSSGQPFVEQEEERYSPAEVIRKNLPHYQSEKVDLRATDPIVEEEDAALKEERPKPQIEIGSDNQSRRSDIENGITGAPAG